MDLLKVAEAAELLRVRPETVYRWINQGVLPSVKLGRLVRINGGELNRLLGALPPPIVVAIQDEKEEAHQER